MNANSEAEARALMELSRRWSATVESGDMEAALENGAPLAHTDEDTNACFTASMGNGDLD